MTKFEACRLAAERQNGLLTREQALDLGLPRGLWQKGAGGLLEPVLPSVKRLSTPQPMPLTERRRQRSRAAVLIGGTGAVAFGASALRVAGIAGTPLRTREEVAVMGAWHQRKGIIRHFEAFEEKDVGVDGGTRYLRPFRSLQDVAGLFTDAELLSVVDSALHLSKLSVPERDELKLLLPGRSAVLNLSSALRESPLESRVALVMALDHIPDITPQVPIRVTEFGDVRVDFLIGECVIVECDGREAHDEISTRYQDRERHEALERMGYILVRVTWADVVDRPQVTIARIRSAMADARARELGWRAPVLALRA